MEETHPSEFILHPSAFILHPLLQLRLCARVLVWLYFDDLAGLDAVVSK
jgi:hypothetical protein